MGEDDVIERILRGFRRFVVIGCSGTPGKDAHDVPAFLARRGLDVVPVNPNRAEVLGTRAFRHVGEVPREPPFCAVVFRPSAEAGRAAADALAAGAGAVWLQLGIRSEQAVRAAEAAGVPFVEDACIRTELYRLQRSQG